MGSTPLKIGYGNGNVPGSHTQKYLFMERRLYFGRLCTYHLLAFTNSINTGFDLMFKSWIQIWTGSTGKHAICTQTGMVHQETCKKYCMFRNNIACYMCEQRCSNLTCSMIWFFLNIWYANLCFMDDLYTKMMGIGSLIIELSNMQLIHLKGDRKREKHVFSVQHAVQRVQSKTSMIWCMWSM